LDVFFDWKTFRGTQSSWKELAYFERPQDKPYAEGRDVIQGACEGEVEAASLLPRRSQWPSSLACAKS
jgi:hypothetical protein